jgi:hypothetical protein
MCLNGVKCDADRKLNKMQQYRSVAITINHSIKLVKHDVDIACLGQVINLFWSSTESYSCIPQLAEV